jgi:tripartite-type tricarboxylate transporter receptor subunit TctC
VGAKAAHTWRAGRGLLPRPVACLGVALASLILLVGCGQQQPFPSRPITLICPWSAGGGTDRVSRQMAMQLERRLGVPVNVINATGGSGVTGLTRGARSRPDGSTLMMMTVELSMLHWRGLTTITYEDFAPLCLLNRDAAAVFVRGDAPYESLAALEAAIREADAPLKASGTAQGGIWHAAVAGWLDGCGLPADAVTWVSLNGSGPSLQELIAGGLDLVCCSVAEADALRASQRVRCLGVMAAQRLPTAPEIPTFREQGFDWAMAGWRGLGVPAGVPSPRLAKLREAVAAEATSEEFQEFLALAGFDHSFEPADTFADTLAAQDRLFERVMTSEALGGVAADAQGGLVFPAAMAILLLIAAGTAVAFPGASPATLPATEGAVAWTSRGFVHALTVVLAVAAFVGLADVVGFLVAASGLLWVGLVRFGTHPLRAAAISLVASGAVQLVFGMLLRVPLPRGLWLDG